MNKYGLVPCFSPDGWSLHAPGSSDEDIADGSATYLLTGPGRPVQADYDAAYTVLWKQKQFDPPLNRGITLPRIQERGDGEESSSS